MSSQFSKQEERKNKTREDKTAAGVQIDGKEKILKRSLGGGGGEISAKSVNLRGKEGLEKQEVGSPRASLTIPGDTTQPLKRQGGEMC